MSRETKSELLQKKKTNAEKMKEARKAKSKAVSDKLNSVSASLNYMGQAGTSSESSTIAESMMEMTPSSELAEIGTAAGKAIQKKPEGYRPAQYVETKTKRVQLVFQPSLHERVKRAAKNHNLSVNEYVHQVLDYATQDD